MSTSSLLQVTFIPTGVADRCFMFTNVPTVLCPSSRYGATLSLAVFSINAIIAGVASTANEPLPNASAVSFAVTVISPCPIIPFSMFYYYLVYLQLQSFLSEQPFLGPRAFLSRTLPSP